MIRTPFAMRALEGLIPYSLRTVHEWDHGRVKNGGKVDLAIHDAIKKLETERRDQVAAEKQQQIYLRVGRPFAKSLWEKQHRAI